MCRQCCLSRTASGSSLLGPSTWSGFSFMSKLLLDERFERITFCSNTSVFCSNSSLLCFIVWHYWGWRGWGRGCVKGKVGEACLHAGGDRENNWAQFSPFFVFNESPSHLLLGWPFRIFLPFWNFWLIKYVEYEFTKLSGSFLFDIKGKSSYLFFSFKINISEIAANWRDFQM